MFLRQYNAESLLGRNDVQHKREAIEEILRAFVDLPFLLIRDGTRDDPEVYLEVVRRHGKRIRAVYLRRAGDPERAVRVEEIARRMRGLGGEVLLVDDSDEIARHAGGRGWIRREDRTRPEADVSAA